MGGVQVGWGIREMGRWVFSQWGRWGKTSVQTFSKIFLKTLTVGAVANPHRKCRPFPSTGCSLRPRRVGGRKNNFGSMPVSKTVWEQAQETADETPTRQKQLPTSNGLLTGLTTRGVNKNSAIATLRNTLYLSIYTEWKSVRVWRQSGLGHYDVG